MTTTRYDCCDAGHKGRFTVRRDGVDFVSRSNRQVWWPYVMRDLGLLGWCETDTKHGDPGNPTMNAKPVTDVYVGAIDNPQATATCILRGGAGPHPMPHPSGTIVRRVKGAGQIELAVLDRLGNTLSVARTLEYATDPSWLAGVGVTYCAGPPRPGTGAAKTPNVEGDALPLVVAPPSLVLYDPVRRAGNDLLVLASTAAGWAIYRYLHPFALPLVPPAPGLVLGPPTTYVADGGEERVLYQCAQTTGQLHAWEAWSVALDGTGHRKEWSAKHPDGKPAAVRFPIVA